MRPKLESSTFLFMAFFLLIYTQLKAQENWTDPIIISDTLTDNRNATVGWIDYYDGEDFYLFWERTIDDSTTAICVRKYYDLDEPIVILSDPGTRYTNPQVMSNYPGVSFILFYQSDETGDQNLYFRTYSNNQLSDPYTASDLPGRDEHLRVNDDHGIVWERNDSIFFTRLVENYQFDSLVIIDTAGSYPEIIQSNGWGYGLMTVAWEKMNDDSSHIFIREYNSWLQQWSDPLQVSQSGHNTSLSFCRSLFQMNPNVILWDNLQSAGHTVQIYDIEMDEMHEMNFRQDEPVLPAMFTYFIPVNEWIDGGFLTFVLHSSDSSYVMGNDGWFSTWVENYFSIHGDTLPKYNLAFFEGDHYGACFNDVICIWEEEKNGIRQLWTSYYPLCLFGSVKENEANPLDLSVSPNPATDAVRISFKTDTPGVATISIFNPSGQLIEKIYTESDGIGQVDHTWNIAETSPGIYFIKVSSDGQSSSAKLLINH